MIESRPAATDPDDRLQILDRTCVFQGFFRLDRFHLRHRLYSGGWSEVMDREVFERGRTVGILLYDPERDRVVLVEQFRLPAHLAGFSGWQLEIVAGIVKPGEDEAAVATRETQEESGLSLRHPPEFVHRFMPSPGGTTEVIDLYCGCVDSSGAGGLFGLADEHEDIKVVVMDCRAAFFLMRRDGIRNGPTVLALYWLAAHRRRLRRQWRPATAPA